MSRLALPKITVSDYLEIDRSAEVKSEYRDGELFPAEAVSFRHSIIASNTARRIAEKLDGALCTVLIDTPSVRVSPTKFVYLDLMVVCGAPEFADEVEDTIVNPKVIIEVLSPSTAEYDYSTKFQLYRNLPSLAEYLLIEQSEPRVEVLLRLDRADWLLSTYTGLDATVPVKCLDVELHLSELYAGVEFPQSSPR